MTDDEMRAELARIKERAEAATPGPWEFAFGDVRGVTYADGRTGKVAHTWAPSDAEFIAHARADVPWLLEIVDNLRRGQEHLADQRDEYHTMDELYEYRMLYNAHAAHGWLVAGIPVVKSWRHSDGELCFGGGWFVVVATLPTGQVSNHYAAEHWNLFSVPEVALPPEYDGHTPTEAADRLRAALTGQGGEEWRP